MVNRNTGLFSLYTNCHILIGTLPNKRRAFIHWVIGSRGIKLNGTEKLHRSTMSHGMIVSSQITTSVKVTTNDPITANDYFRLALTLKQRSH